MHKPKKKPMLAPIKPAPGPHGPIPETKDVMPDQPMNPYHDDTCPCAMCKGMYPKYK